MPRLRLRAAVIRALRRDLEDIGRRRVLRDLSIGGTLIRLTGGRQCSMHILMTTIIDNIIAKIN